MRSTKENLLKTAAILAAISASVMGITPVVATHGAGTITIYYGDDETLDPVWQYDECTGKYCTALEGTGEGSTLASRSTQFASEEERSWVGADFILERRCDTQAIVAPFAMLFTGTLSATTQTEGTGTASTIIRAHPIDPQNDLTAGTLAAASAGADVPTTPFAYVHGDIGILPEGSRRYTPVVSIESDVETGAEVEGVPPSATATGYFKLDRIDVQFGDETGPVISFQATSADTPSGGGPVGFQGWYQEPVTILTDAPDPVEANGLAIANSCTKKISLFADQTLHNEEDLLAGGSLLSNFTTDGRWDLSALAFDYAGNPASAAGFEFGIDRVAPTVSGNGLVPPDPNGLNGWYRDPVNGEARVSVHRSCADPLLPDGEEGSACQGIFWRFNGNNYQNGGTPLTKTFVQGHDVTYDTYAPDNAGNGGVATAVRVGPLDVDFGFPSVGIDPHPSNGWHKNLADVVNIRCTFDQISGCAPEENDQYKCDGAEFARIPAPYNIRDNAGNWVNNSLPGGFGCDATRPTIAGLPTLLVTTNTVNGKRYTSVTPSWEFECSTDALSGVASYELRINGNAHATLGADCGPDGKHTYTMSPAVPNVEYCLRAVAIDNAGNRDAGVGVGTCVTFDNLAPDLSWVVPQPGLYWEGTFIPAPIEDARVLGDLDVNLGIVDEIGTLRAEIWLEGGTAPDELVGPCGQQDLTNCVWEDHPDQQDITWDGEDINELYAFGWDYANNKNSTAVDYWRIGFASVADICEDHPETMCSTLLWPTLMNGAPGTVATIYKSTNLATLFSATNVLTTVPTAAAGKLQDAAVTGGTTYYYGLRVVNGLDEDVYRIRYVHNNAIRYTMSEII